MIVFSEMMKDELINNDRDDEWGKGDTDEVYHPSSIGVCNRQLLLRKADLIKVSLETLGVFYIGKDIHRTIQEITSKIYQNVDIEKSVVLPIVSGDTQLLFKGSIDILHNNIVYDIKSVSNMFYYNCIKPEHKIQVCIYMKAVNSVKSSIIYVDKNNYRIRQFTYNFDGVLYEQICKKVLLFHNIYMKWKNNGAKIDEIPFKKCSCWYCKNEVLKDDNKLRGETKTD